MSYYLILADVILVLHLAYMGYVVFGQLLILIGWPLGWKWIRNPWFRLTHLALIGIVAVEAIYDYKCPLTVWEHDLRVAARGEPDADEEEEVSFTTWLMQKVMFAADDWPEWEKPSFYIAAGTIVATLFLVPPRFRRQAPLPDRPSSP